MENYYESENYRKHRMAKGEQINLYNSKYKLRLFVRNGKVEYIAIEIKGQDDVTIYNYAENGNDVFSNIRHTLDLKRIILDRTNDYEISQLKELLCDEEREKISELFNDEIDNEINRLKLVKF